MLKYSISKNVKKKITDDSFSISDKKQPLIEKLDQLKEPKLNSIFYVEEYEENCEEHFKINKVICLMREDRKYIIFILLNIFTLGLINLVLNWSPQLKMCLIFTNSSVKNATHVGIFGADKKFYIVEAYEIELPKLKFSHLLNYCKNNVHTQKTKVFEFKLQKFLYSPIKKSFLNLKFLINSSFDVITRKFIAGLNQNEVDYQKILHGSCDLEVEIDSAGELLLKEVKDPFYVFQLFSVIVWIFNNYIKYSLVIILSTLTSLTVAIYELKTNLESIKSMARYECDVVIHRIQNGKKKEIEMKSVELVPGDLFELPDDDVLMPCDALLISGSVIMNESILTGESVPILKINIPNITTTFDKKLNSKHIVYSGTKIIQKRSMKDSKVMAVVISTGFNTEKGKLIRSVLFAIESNSKFQSDFWRYIIFMFFLSLIGIIFSFKFMIDYQMPLSQIVIKGFDLITTAVPPALPAVLAIGISYTLNRLKIYGIKCINRQKVNLPGQINLICFDKTGTLTEDHLQIYGFRPINYSRGNFIFDIFVSDYTQMVNESYKFHKQNENYDEINTQGGLLEISNLNNFDKIKMLRVLFVECLATCHSITKVNGKLIGDPVDVEMFESTGWILKENSEMENHDPLVLNYVRHHLEKDPSDLIRELRNLKIDNILEKEEILLMSLYEIGIVRRFEFSSKLQRMSVIVKNVNEDHFKIFCKGSPEKIKDLCREDTIPDNFNQILNKYTSKGFRVLALCGKLIKMDYIQSQKMMRESAESNMIFLGFIIVQNKLKNYTTPSIEILQNAGFKLIMATGDNILTASSVSRECGMITSNASVYQVDISNEGSDNKEFRLNCFEIYKPQFDEENELESSSIAYSEGSNYFLRKRGISESLDNIRRKQQSISKSSESEYIPINADNDASNFQGSQNKLSSMKYFNKLIKNLNVEVIEDSEDLTDEEDYDIAEEDSENLRVKKNSKKRKSTNKIEFEIDTLRIEMENLLVTQGFGKEDDYVIAVSGNAFEALHQLNKKYLLTKLNQYRVYHQIFRFLLSKAKIYGRMSPDQKTILIESLKSEKFIVAMVGDGVNDMGALRAADVGVSLSRGEASIAAHFTSSVPEIVCLIKLIREGKASLVTSIQSFKFMMLFSMIQFFSTIILLVTGTYLSEYEFLAVDFFLIFPLAILIARTGAYSDLTPHKPTGALISTPIISSVIIQSILQLAIQYFSYLLLTYQSWYVPYKRPSLETFDVTEPNYENTTIFLVTYLQNLIIAVAFSISKPFKKEIQSNYLLCAFLAASFVFAYYLILVYDQNLNYYFGLLEIKHYTFRIILIIITIVNFILSVLVENFIVPTITNKWNHFKREKLSKEINQSRKSFDLSELDQMKLNLD